MRKKEGDVRMSEDYICAICKKDARNGVKLLERNIYVCSACMRQYVNSGWIELLKNVIRG